jgi:hypothetical protein
MKKRLPEKKKQKQFFSNREKAVFLPDGIIESSCSEIG